MGKKNSKKINGFLNPGMFALKKCIFQGGVSDYSILKVQIR